ncbi:MAG: hypothetical protein IJ647_02355 [Prevotella sp.]|nr:hypothetical protein [Prevotella sp.]
MSQRRCVRSQPYVVTFTGENHSGCVNGGIVGKKGNYLGFHVIIWRNDVQEILDDAKVEIDA